MAAAALLRGATSSSFLAMVTSAVPPGCYVGEDELNEFPVGPAHTPLQYTINDDDDDDGLLFFLFCTASRRNPVFRSQEFWQQG